MWKTPPTLKVKSDQQDLTNTKSLDWKHVKGLYLIFQIISSTIKENETSFFALVSFSNTIIYRQKGSQQVWKAALVNIFTWTIGQMITCYVKGVTHNEGWWTQRERSPNSAVPLSSNGTLKCLLSHWFGLNSLVLLWFLFQWQKVYLTSTKWKKDKVSN